MDKNPSFLNCLHTNREVLVRQFPNGLGIILNFLLCIMLQPLVQEMCDGTKRGCPTPSHIKAIGWQEKPGLFCTYPIFHSHVIESLTLLNMSLQGVSPVISRVMVWLNIRICRKRFTRTLLAIFRCRAPLSHVWNVKLWCLSYI